ncbi:hypothetical protein QTJ16_000894 [Diplocarpon rosae]|uniref:Histone-lysine N-methyltransferase, H3 lysine-36 specific n=1 Tax=Diplocarpon rosae TaxID=946125 RepID=A0AAD9T781_9HELO|nr:hypothetical protein QTJ16_000894 [Diplocarpon rosae]
MVDDTRDTKPGAVDAALGEMKIEEGDAQAEGQDTIMVNGSTEEETKPSYLIRSPSSTSTVKMPASQSPYPKEESTSLTPKSQNEVEEVIGGDITVTVEPGKGPKLLRKSAQKVIARQPPLFNDLPDATARACEVFQVIKDCIYGSKHMGSSDHDALDCECPEDADGAGHGENHACGEDSDCINRATKMECVDTCSGCENQRFQQKKYANVSVIQTEKKGFGLRANVDLDANDFIFEYIGEVINEPTFRRRTIQYDQEGIKHFYFMSLTKHEFVDATKKGNLGRFCNHSCNPNCYVDKWVVGDKLRMGIFAERNIKAGEELVFNYNVDRYGADPQPCYCAEPNCTGYIGGKTQTERATKLSHATIEALGIDDGDGWDSAEYVNNVQPKGLDEEGVRKVMATLMQCKEKWIAVKLLSRIQRCNDDKVRNRVVQMHGYQILRTTLITWKDDNNVVLQILDILYKFPRLTKNKITDSKIEATIEPLKDSEHEDVAKGAQRLIDDWSKLDLAYRIPRKKFDPTAVPVFERRNNDRAEDLTRSSATPAFVAPAGPRSNDEKGNTYYYSKSGQTTWVKPYLPAPEPPPPPQGPPKSAKTAKALQDIIDSITKPDPKTPTPAITGTSTPKEAKKPVEKWRALTQEKQMKLYENTLFPHVRHVMKKFSKQLPKDDLKKFGKEVAKKLVASDYKNNRVEDPTKISEKQEKKVKTYVRDFFERAVEKKKVMDKRKREKVASSLSSLVSSSVVNGHKTATNGDIDGKAVEVADDGEADDAEADDADAIDLTPSPIDPATPSLSPTSASNSNSDLKRKRDDGEGDGEGESTPGAEDSFSFPHISSESHKRLKEEGGPGGVGVEIGILDGTPPPPPPPPPTLPDEVVPSEEESEEAQELRRQEEDLMRENEEAMACELVDAGAGESHGMEEKEAENSTGVNGNGLGHTQDIADAP